VISLVVLDQFLIGQSALVEVGALAAQVGLSTLASRLLGGDPRPLLSFLGTPNVGFGLITMLGGDPLAALSELPLALPDAGTLTEHRQE
jgi:hypothetical protein